MSSVKPTDKHLKEAGLERDGFNQLDPESKEYVLGRIQSYDRLDKLYQIMQAVEVIKKEKGGEVSQILEDESNQKLILDFLRDYRSENSGESVEEFYGKWTKKM